MDELTRGVLRFEKNIYPERKEFFDKLIARQYPRALFITCADSRVVPNMITDSEPGDLFTIRNAGNIVPPYGEALGGVSASIEYAVMALGVKHIIICGHTDCGAMKAVWHPESAEELKCVKNWLVNGKDARKRAMAKKLPEERQLQEITERNVVVQLEHLRTYPSVARALAAGKLEIAGWVYDIEHGKVLEYHAEGDEFRVLRV